MGGEVGPAGCYARTPVDLGCAPRDPAPGARSSASGTGSTARVRRRARWAGDPSWRRSRTRSRGAASARRRPSENAAVGSSRRQTSTSRVEDPRWSFDDASPPPARRGRHVDGSARAITTERPGGRGVVSEIVSLSARRRRPPSISPSSSMIHAPAPPTMVPRSRPPTRRTTRTETRTLTLAVGSLAGRAVGRGVDSAQRRELGSVTDADDVAGADLPTSTDPHTELIIVGEAFEQTTATVAAAPDVPGTPRWTFSPRPR